MLSARPPLPRVDLARAQRAASLLDRAIGPSKVLTGREACEPYAADRSEAEPAVPDVVVLASSDDDIVATLRVAAETMVPVTPRAGGSGKTGGAVPSCGGIVISCTGMAQLKEIDRDNLLAVVGPGVILADMAAAAEREGLFYPPDPQSAAYCCVAGTIAENAGGPRAVKYGVTREHVLGLEAFLMGGERISVGRRTVKGVTGYDMTALLVGSEGTLAMLGDATMRLVPLPERVGTLMALFSSVRDAGRAVSRIIASGIVPRCLELLDGTTLMAVRKGGVAIDERAGAMLLIEVDGDEHAVTRQAERVGEACAAASSIAVVTARDEAETARLWAARKEMSPSIKKLTRFKLSEDIVVPRSRVADLIDELDRIGERNAVRTLTYGHAGDGNLHCNFLWDDESSVPAVNTAVEQLFRATLKLGGTLSGEHGIGVLKAAYLGLEQGEPLIALQQAIKAQFDPKGLLNPGKIFWPRSHRAC